MPWNIDINFIFGLIGVFGTLLGLISVLVAIIQTKKLNEVKKRSEADLIETIINVRDLLKCINGKKKDAIVTTANTLQLNLIKEFVVRGSSFNLKSLRKLKKSGKFTDNEYQIAKKFIPPAVSVVEKVREAVAELRLNNKNQRDFLRIVNELGVIATPETFPTELINKGIGNAEEKVKISTTWIHNIKLENFLIEALNNENCEVEILLLDYELDIAKQRSVDLMKDISYVPEQIKTTLQWLLKIFSENSKGKKNRIAVYDTAPIFLMYLFDKRLVFCPSFYGKKFACSRRQFVVEGEDTEFYTTMEEQFNILSQRAKTIFPDNTHESKEYIERLKNSRN